MTTMQKIAEIESEVTPSDSLPMSLRIMSAARACISFEVQLCSLLECAFPASSQECQHVCRWLGLRKIRPQLAIWAC